MAPGVHKDKEPRGKGQSESVEVPGGAPQLVVTPSPAPIGTTHLDIAGTGFPSGYLQGTVSGKGPGFEFVGESDRTGVWDNPNAPLGVGVSTPDNPEGHYPETHWVTISDGMGNEVARQEVEVQ